MKAVPLGVLVRRQGHVHQGLENIDGLGAQCVFPSCQLWLSDSTLSVYPKEMTKYKYTQHFFYNSENWKQPKFPTKGR